MMLLLVTGVYAQYYNTYSSSPNTYGSDYYGTQNYNTNYYSGYNNNYYGTSSGTDYYGNSYDPRAGSNYAGGGSGYYGGSSYGNPSVYNSGYNSYSGYNNNYYGSSGGYNDYNSYYNSGSNYYQSTSGTYGSSGYNSMSTYWPQFSSSSYENCDGATSDFIIAIPPGACTPNVVRSDLLAEQNVPVFCKLSALKINPLIDVSAIQSISFSGDYPEGVAGVSYHPARQAVRSYNTLLSSPYLNDAGYVVISLSRQADERTLPKFIEGNLTARIRYDARHLSGVGQAEYYLEAGDEKVSFWNGKGWLDVEDVGQGYARINVYTRRDTAAYQTVTLREGQLSQMIYFPGYYCSAGVQLRLNRIVAPDDMALLNVEGDQIWVRQGTRFMENMCQVLNLNVFPDNTGNIDISCAGKRFNLKLGGKGVAINNGENIRDYQVGEPINYGSKNYYLAYYGQGPKGMNFIMLTTKQLNDLDLTYVSNHYASRDWENYDQVDFEKSIGGSSEGSRRIGQLGKDYFILYPETEDDMGSSLDGISFSQISGKFEDIDNYGVAYELKEGEKIVNELVDYYPSEEKMEGVYWGEEALFEQITIAGQAGYTNTQMELIEKFKQAYPSSDYLYNVLEIERRHKQYDSSESHANVMVNNEYFNIFVESFRAEKDLDKSATIKIGGRSAEFVREGDVITFDDGNLTIEKIDVNGVMFRYQSIDGRNEGKGIGLESYGQIGSREIEVRDIESRQVAYVSIVPNLNKQFSEANFAFKIGVEKRNIQLNPDKTKEAIEGLNQTIAMWEDILDRLGKVIKIWKAVCFATSTILMLETMLDGFDGESLARSKIMQHYKTICDVEIGKGTYKTRTECYNDISGRIDSDIERMKNAMNSVNSELNSVQVGNTQTTGILGKEGVINQTKYVEDLKKKLQWEGLEIEGVKIEANDLTKSTEISSILLYQKLGCKVTEKDCIDNPSVDVACCSAFDEMKRNLGSAAIQKKADEEGKRTSENIKKITGGVNPSVQTVNSEGVRTLTWNGQTGEVIKTNRPADIGSSDKIQFLNLDGKTYLLKLKDSTLGGTMGIDKAYILDNGNQWKEVTNLRQDGLDKFVFMGGSQEACKGNIIKNPEVRFYESGRNQGLPAIVPFDLQDGWYAYVPNSQGSMLEGTQKSYTAAGDINFFWICNVGRNGIVEQKSGDDLCQSFSANQVGFDTFISCGMQGREVGQLYARARDAIRQAAQGYGRKGYINILGQSVKNGAPLSDTGGSECQDFMSPNDCKMLFNACDPVICPPSRCDMGGKYPVSDVVQTGIIGSIVLCLPNVREGIVFPVCLTGIHAGIDAFVSILRSEKDCLQQNLDSGEYVGICDEITAIYMCEFFWRNFGSILDVILPSFFESAFGQPSTRGGGEYLTVQSAWDNLGKSMEFFTGTYAENAMTAFNLRSSTNIGTEICNGFLGTSVPIGMSAEGFDALLSPESPTQFYAYFSEVPFTDATSPATSHYKVYYHIYAGNDFGASYQVYLRNPPAGGYYATMPVANVKTGYAARGQSADEAIDFTAPSGYKELCVRINNEEHCGFGTVSSNFAVNYATEKYSEDQATKTDITTEAECVSTSASAWGLVSPNLQSGLETSAGGRDINLIGITRICASQNPDIGIASPNNQVVCSENADCGSGYVCKKVSGSELGNCVDRNGNVQQSAGRWVDVGYCDDPSIRCWLDSSSLQGRFNAVNAVNQELYGQQTSVMDAIKYGQMFDEVQQNYEQARAILSEQYNRILELTPTQLEASDSDSTISNILSKLDQIIGVYAAGLGTSNNKAEALALKATVYRMIVEQKMRGNVDVSSSGSTYVSVDPINPENCIGSDCYVSVDTFIPDDTAVLEDYGNKPVDLDTGTPTIRILNGRDYIAQGGFVSDVYIEQSNGRYLIFKENTATGGNPTIVGSIGPENEVLITQRNLDYLDRKLDYLVGFYYDTTLKGFYVTTDDGRVITDKS